ncbi:MAG: (2Fe-2S)-binding protein [Clostridia bacterium]|jgi:predicted molibdopterin-dependent oxidoreductase YjgC|nr:(2Fe-2S)-binding protein [Clostridia bacterium]
MRILDHPILGSQLDIEYLWITVDGKKIKAKKGETIAASLLANNIRIHRYTSRYKEPRGIYCGIGQCTDCVMTVNNVPNIRTCITPVEDGMIIQTQYGHGRRGEDSER